MNIMASEGGGARGWGPLAQAVSMVVDLLEMICTEFDIAPSICQADMGLFISESKVLGLFETVDIAWAE